MAGKAKTYHRAVETTEMMAGFPDENAFTFLLRAPWVAGVRFVQNKANLPAWFKTG